MQACLKGISYSPIGLPVWEDCVAGVSALTKRKLVVACSRLCLHFHLARRLWMKSCLDGRTELASQTLTYAEISSATGR